MQLPQVDANMDQSLLLTIHGTPKFRLFFHGTMQHRSKSHILLPNINLFRKKKSHSAVAFSNYYDLKLTSSEE
jgi:hypothetical protein